MSPAASLVTTNGMQQCAYWYLQSISVTVSLLYSVGNKTLNYCSCYCYCYCCCCLCHWCCWCCWCWCWCCCGCGYGYGCCVYDSWCWHMYIYTTPGSVPSKASSLSCLWAEEQALPHLTGLNWFAILHRFVQLTHIFVQLRSLLMQVQPGNFHDLLHMHNSSCKAVSDAVTPQIDCIKHLCPTRGLWEQLELVTENASRWQPCN